MATLTLDRGNFVLLGLNNEGRYNEFFGQIVDYREDENNRGTYWLKIQVSYEVREMREHDELISISSTELGSIPKLESFDQEEGERIIEGFKETLERRARDIRDAENLERRRERTRLAQEADQLEEIQDIEEQDSEEVESDQDEDRRRPRPRTGQPTEAMASLEPSPPPPDATLQIVGDDVPLVVDAKEFSLNMESGDMKTILKIAEKSPARVFGVIDKAVHENGHLVFNYMTQNLRTKIIDLKISATKVNEEIMLVHGKTYKINKGNEQGIGVYLGRGYWVFPRSLTQISDINEALVKLPENFLENFSCELVENQAILDDVQNLVKATVETLPDEVRYYLDEGISNNTLDYSQTFKLSSELEKITAENFGEEWEKTITYYYFIGGEFQWDDIALDTFSDKDSIIKLATVREDEHVLGLLEAA